MPWRDEAGRDKASRRLSRGGARASRGTSSQFGIRARGRRAGAARRQARRRRARHRHVVRRGAARSRARAAVRARATGLCRARRVRRRRRRRGRGAPSTAPAGTGRAAAASAPLLHRALGRRCDAAGLERPDALSIPERWGVRLGPVVEPAGDARPRAVLVGGPLGTGPFRGRPARPMVKRFARASSSRAAASSGARIRR
jgi:hypothetical protein